MDLSIIIVNWHSASYLHDCLSSIYNQTKDLDFEVIVVDNASYDGSEELIKAHFPAGIFVQSKENLGFARANNLGFQHSSGDALLFLNPDTQVVGSAVNFMFSQLRTLPDAGIVGCKLLNSDLSVQTTCIQRFPTIMNQILLTDHLILRFPHLKFFGVRPLFFYNGHPEPVEVVSGACLMIKRAVFEKIEMFSSDYFMYAEDLDLCYKVRKTGLKAYYAGDVSVIHHGGRSVEQTKVSYVNSVLVRESVKRLLAKHKGQGTAFLYQVSMAGVSLVRICLLILVSPIAIYRGRPERIKASLLESVKVLRWSLGMEPWARSPSWRQPSEQSVRP